MSRSSTDTPKPEGLHMPTAIEEHDLDPELLPHYTPEPSTEARMIAPVLEAINDAVQHGAVRAVSTITAQFYQRKDNEPLRSFGDPRNVHYDRGGGDYYLQIGVRIPTNANRNKALAKQLAELEIMSDAQLLKEKQKALHEAKARTENARQAEAHLQAEIDRLSPNGA